MYTFEEVGINWTYKFIGDRKIIAVCYRPQFIFYIKDTGIFSLACVRAARRWWGLWQGLQLRLSWLKSMWRATGYEMRHRWPGQITVGSWPKLQSAVTFPGFHTCIKGLCEKWPHFTNNWRGVSIIFSGPVSCKASSTWDVISLVPYKAFSLGYSMIPLCSNTGNTL